MNGPGDSRDDGPVEEIRALVGPETPGFTRKIHRSIERRVLVRDLSVMSWELPKLVFSEALFVCAQWFGGSNRRSGGRS